MESSIKILCCIIKGFYVKRIDSKNVRDLLTFKIHLLIYTPVCLAEKDNEFNPNATIGVKARVLSLAFKELDIPLADHQCTLLILNHLKFRIARPGDQRERFSIMIDPYSEPGGLSPEYNASLGMRLTNRKSKDSYVLDENGYRIGSEVKLKIHKSRFGSEGRECTFKILWANEVKILDEESWFEPFKRSEKVKISGSWITVDGFPKKFQPSQWMEMLSDPIFKEIVIKILDQELITNFDQRLGKAYYDVDGEDSAQPQPSSEED